MVAEVIMPKLGLTMTEGTVLQWLKNEGDRVKSGEPLFEVETDKVALEVNAMDSGVLLKITAEPGDTIPVAGVIGYIGEPGEAVPPNKEIPFKPISAERTSSEKQPNAYQPEEMDEVVRISGLARRLARENNIDYRQLHGTGPQGRIVEADILNAIEAQQAAAEVEVPHIRVSGIARRMAEKNGIDLSIVRGSGPQGRIVKADIEKMLGARRSTLEPADRSITAEEKYRSELHPISQVQTISARRMTESFQTAPHFYLGVDITITRLVAFREHLTPYVESRMGVRLTYTDFILRALALTLPEHLKLNASWEDGQLRVYQHVNLGVAMATDRGLVVGVIPMTEGLPLEEIASQRALLSEKARSGKLIPTDIEGGTFTLTNLGMYGIDDFAPILNPPQSAILGVGAIVDRPVGEQGQIVLRPVVHLTLSVDHRVVDGIEGAQFLQTLRHYMEDPSSLL